MSCTVSHRRLCARSAVRFTNHPSQALSHPSQASSPSIPSLVAIHPKPRRHPHGPAVRSDTILDPCPRPLPAAPRCLLATPAAPPGPPPLTPPLRIPAPRTHSPLRPIPDPNLPIPDPNQPISDPNLPIPGPNLPISDPNLDLLLMPGVVELYLYVVFCVFWSGPPLGSAAFDEQDASMPLAVRRMLSRLNASMCGSGVDDGSAQEVMSETRRTCASISLERLRAPLESQPLMALRETVVGMESLRRVADMLRSHGGELSRSLGDAGQRQLSSFLEGTLDQVPAMCALIYRRVAGSILDLEPIVGSIRNRSWALKEIGTQHNAYVDQLLQLLQQLSTEMLQLAVPPRVLAAVMEGAVAFVCEQLVDGYSQTKKCSDEGRALMSLDVKTLQVRVVSVVGRLGSNHLAQIRCGCNTAQHRRSRLGGTPQIPWDVH